MSTDGIDFTPDQAAPAPGGTGGIDFTPDAPPGPGTHFGPDPHAGMTHVGPIQSADKSLTELLYPEVDFHQGLPFVDREHLGQADNFEEKKAYLEQVYGKKNVEIDSDAFGSPMLVVLQNGRKVAAEGGSGFESFVAHTIGTAPEWMGASAGAILGTPADVASGPGGTLAGAALGGAAGKASIEAYKGTQGWLRQTPPEQIKHVAMAGGESALGQEFGDLTANMISRVMRGPLPEIITQTTPESRALTERALAGGARPPAESTVPGAKKLAWTEALARKTVSGVRSQDAANTAYVEDRMRDILRESGVPENQLDNVLKEMASDSSAVPTAEVGEHVKVRVQAQQRMLAGNVETRLTAANAELDKQVHHIDVLTRRYEPGDLGVDVAGAVRQARRDFGTAMSKVYDKIDTMVGDRKLVPYELIRKEAAKIARKLPKSAQAGVTKELAQLPAAGAGAEEDAALFAELGIERPAVVEGKISFADAQRIRTLLRERSDESSLTRGATRGEFAQLANSVDWAIQQAGKDPAAADAVRLLNAADKAYGQGIKRFNDATVRQLVKNLEAGLPPDPEVIAGQIVRPGQEARVREVRKMVGEQVWSRVAGADYSRMVQAATGDDGQVDGAVLLSQINQRGKLMGAVYGDNLSGQITELARALAVRDGKLPVSALSPGAIRNTLRALRTSEDAEERFLKESYLGVLANPRRSPERVYKWLVRPDNSGALNEAVRLFGENSPQIQGLRQAALKQLLINAKMAYADGRGAGALTDALSKFTTEQQRVLFPNGMADDLNLLGKEVQFLMRTHSDESKASFAAGAVLALPFAARIPVQVGIGVVQTILSQPAIIRYLALGLRSPPGPARQAARGMLTNLIRYGAISPSVASNEGAPPRGQKEPALPGTPEGSPAVAAAQ